MSVSQVTPIRRLRNETNTQAWQIADLIQNRSQNESEIKSPESLNPQSQDWNGGAYTLVVKNSQQEPNINTDDSKFL